MEEIYLNHADGRKPRKLSKLKVKNPTQLFHLLILKIREILSISKNDFLSSSQNTTTSLIKILMPLLKNNNYQIFLDSHEIHWYKTLFIKGGMPTNEVTYPNYAKLRQVSFLKKRVTYFEPNKLAENPGKILGKKPAIVIISHVSRLTGGILLTSKLYKKVKKLNPKNIVIVDGSQAVGAMKIRVKTLADIYIGVTSKFIQAEPHIGFCWISSKIVRDFKIKKWDIEPYEYRREIYSAYRYLKILSRKRSVWAQRSFFKKRLKRVGIPISQIPHQVSHLLLIPSTHSTEVVKRLKKKSIIVSSNIGFSVKEPKIPGLRISLSPQLSNKDIKIVVQALVEIKKDGFL